MWTVIGFVACAIFFVIIGFLYGVISTLYGVVYKPDVITKTANRLFKKD